jgi:thymidylate synthase (FAD)
MKVKLLKFTKEADKLCASAAKLCYENSNIYNILKKLTLLETKNILKKIISSGHCSVLEHASFTFYIENISRSLLAQFTRHRIASFSVQSQRYVNFKKNMSFIIPESIKKDVKLLKFYKKSLLSSYNLYKYLLSVGIAAEDARYVLPNASETKIIVTMNARELRHFFSLRMCNRAQLEIRTVANRMLSLVKKKAPLLFYDSGANCIKGKCIEFFSCGNPFNKNIKMK